MLIADAVEDHLGNHSANRIFARGFGVELRGVGRGAGLVERVEKLGLRRGVRRTFRLASRNWVSGEAFGEPFAGAALGERTATVTQSTIVAGNSGCTAKISTPCPPVL